MPPTEEELAGWRELPPGADELATRARGRPTRDAAEEFYLRTFAEPALDVNGIESGSPHLQKTVLPVEARREPLDPARARAGPSTRSRRRSSGCCGRPRPTGASSRSSAGRRRRPASCRRTRAAIKLGQDAFERVVGRRPALIRSGGTLPIVPALADKGIPAIITGFGLPDSQIHSPNERLVADYVPLGIATARELFRELAAL